MQVKEVELPVYLRPVEPADLPFIITSWVESYFRQTGFERHHLAKDYYKNEFTRIIKRLLKRSSTVVVCNREEHGQVMGFCTAEIVSERKIVFHFIYVKHKARHLGLAKLMFESFRPALFTRRYCSHAIDITLRRKFGVFFNPFEVHKSVIRHYQNEDDNEI